MHATTLRLPTQELYFPNMKHSQSKQSKDRCHFYHFHIFQKCKNNEQIVSFNYKVYNFAQILWLVMKLTYHYNLEFSCKIRCIIYGIKLKFLSITEKTKYLQQQLL